MWDCSGRSRAGAGCGRCGPLAPVVLLTLQQTTVCLLVVVRPLQTFPQCDHHHGGCHQSFVPAPPGKTPECARPGSTFCENIEHYPTHLIHYLVERNGYNLGSLLVDESLNDFRPRPVYGPPPPPPSYGPPLKYYPANTTTGWYPDRPKFPHFVSHGAPIFYTTAWQPAQYWWQRYARSNQESSAALNTKTHPRKKRQVGNVGSGVTQLCPTMKRYIQPKAAMNDKGNWMYVVNLGDVNPNFTQLVVAETCTSFRCNGLCSIPNGYTSRCEQQYVQKRLIALEGGGNRLYQDTFWFPHCCICQITPANSG